MASSGKMSLDQAILRVIASHDVPDQATLLVLLGQENFSLTQGTLSRRLSKLSIQKRDGKYKRVIPQDHPLPPYTLVESPPNLLVLQTGPGLGMALAIRVDRSSAPGVAGTLAGEDTLFVSVAKESSLAEVRAQIVRILGQPQ